MASDAVAVGMAPALADSSLVMIGNPGGGKSTAMNCLVEEHLFKSGTSPDGCGVTYQLDSREHQGIRYTGTPGLADIDLRKAAAAAIQKALRIGGDFRIIFVLLLDDNRIRDDDLLTMNLVLEAANQIPQNCYAIMFNKCPLKAIKKLNMANSKLNDKLTDRGVPTTDLVHFAPKNEDLEAEDDMVAPLPYETKEFLLNAPRLEIDADKVNDLDAESYDQMRDALAEEQAQTRVAEEAREKSEQREREALEQQK
mmetsp:Transcript_87120/g.172956  ORF Transcript_87120/g.172956 Transcript_87120/m.172956 type:complete len:254 (-) Transcript_87120:881-1642(-)